MEVCPDAKFQNFVRREFTTLRGCLSKKISWTMLSVILTGVGLLSGLVYAAYSGAQEEKEDCIKKNSEQVQELRTNMKVMQAEFRYVSGNLADMNQKSNERFILIMKQVGEIQDEKSKRSGSRISKSYYKERDSED